MNKFIVSEISLGLFSSKEDIFAKSNEQSEGLDDFQFISAIFTGMINLLFNSRF